MFKFLKKTASFGSGSKGKMNDDTLAIKSDTEPAKFDITDQGVVRISDILEIAVRTKLSDPTADPLDIVSDETVDSLIVDFLEKKIGKSEYENYSANTLWSVAIRVLESGEQILSSDICEQLRSASSVEVTKIIADMSLPAQRLLGIVFAAGEMFIRDEPSCAPLVLTRLANVFLWNLPANSFVSINALVNLLLDHRRLLPSCHTFTRKISSATTHISPEEWRAFATKACAVYGQADSSSPSPSAGGIASDSSSVPAASAPVQELVDPPLAPSPSSSEPTLSAATTSGERKEPRSAPWVSSKSARASYASDLPLNDINASASIDVAALRGQTASERNALLDAEGSAAPQGGIASSSNISSSSSNNSSPSTQDSSHIEGLGLGGTLRIRDLQGVFSSALVSRASLDYLPISASSLTKEQREDDYADIRTLSGTIKWILQAQDLSDAVSNSDKAAADAYKGMLSWKSFLRLSLPFLVSDDVAYLRTAEGAAVKYDTTVQETRVVSAATARSAPAAMTGAAEAKSEAPRVSAAALAKTRSRQGFKDAESGTSSEEEGDEQQSQSKAASRNNWNNASAKKSTFSTQDSAANKWDVASSSKTRSAAAAAVGSKIEESSWDSDSSPLSASAKQSQEGEEELSDVDELDLSGSARGKSTAGSAEQLHAHANTAAAAGRSVPLNKKINVRRKWEDSSEASDDDIGSVSITSAGRSSAARQYSGIQAGGRALGASNASSKLNSSRVFEMDLLDESLGSAPLLRDLSMSSTRSTEGLRGLNIESDSSRVTAGTTAEQAEGVSQRYMHNSFDDDEDDMVGAQDQQAERKGGAAAQQQFNSGAAQQLLASSFDEDSGIEEGETKQDSDALFTTDSAAAVDVSALTVPSVGTTEVGSEEGSVKPKKGALKKAAKGAKKLFGKVFSLTSTSSNNSVASASASEASPLPSRPRLDSAASDITAASDAGSTREGGASYSAAGLEGGAKKKKGMFSKLKSKLTRSRSGSRDSSAAERVLDTASDAGSDIGAAHSTTAAAEGVAAPSGNSALIGAPAASASTGSATPSQGSPVFSEQSSEVASAKLEGGIAAHHDEAAAVEICHEAEGSVAEVALSQQPAPSRTSSFRGGIPQPILARTNSLRSEAASEASSTRTADTGTSAGSGADGKKKRPPSLKGMMHKTYKVVFQRGGKASSKSTPPDSSLDPAPSLSVGDGDSPDPGSPSSDAAPPPPSPSVSTGNSDTPAAVSNTTGTPATTPVPPVSQPKSDPVVSSPQTAAEPRVASPAKPLKPKSAPHAQAAASLLTAAPEETADAAAATASTKQQSPVKPPKRFASAAQTEAANKKTQEGLQTTNIALPAPSAVRHSKDMCEGSVVDDVDQSGRESKRADPTVPAGHSGAGHSHGPGVPKTPSIYQALPPSSSAVPVTSSETPLPPPVHQPPQQQQQGQPELPSSQSDPTAASPGPPPSGAGSGDIVVERKLSNPALKRSSFKLSSLLSGFSGSKNSSRSSSRAHSRSNSFSGGAESVAAQAASAQQLSPTPSSGGDRSESGGSATHSASRNGTGLAALLRGGGSSFNSASLSSTQPGPLQSVDSNLGPRSPSASSVRSAQAASDAIFLDRIRAVLERSKAHTEAVQSKVANSSNSSAASSLPQQQQRKGAKNVMDELQMVQENKHRRQQQLLDSGADVAHKQQADHAELLCNWRDLTQRREPRSLHLDATALQNMRTLALNHLQRATDRSVDQSTTAEELVETAKHRLQKQRLSQVPDPLFGLRIHGPMRMECGTSQRLSKSVSKLSRSLAQAWPNAPSCALSALELDAVIATNALYSELDLALGVRLAGSLSRVASRMWQKRHFVLIAEPSRNPNLAAVDMEPWTSAAKPLPTPTAPEGPVAADSSGRHSNHLSMHAASVATEQHPVEYFLLEYAKSAPSRWGNVPVRLLKRYALADVLSIRTDSRPSKKGLEFTITLRKPRDDPLPVPVPLSSAAVDASDSSALHAPAPAGAAAAKPTWRGLLKRSHGVDKIATLVQQAQQGTTGEAPLPAHADPTQLTGSTAPAAPIAPTASAEQPLPSSAPNRQQAAAHTSPAPPLPSDVPSVVPSEESFVVETRWTRLLKKAQPTPPIPSADSSAGAAPPAEQRPLPATPAAASIPSVIEATPPTSAPVASVGTDHSSGTDKADDVESDGEDNAESVRRSRALSGAVSDAASVYSGVSTDEDGEGEELLATGDYYYRAHTHDGVQDSSSGQATGKGKIETRKLRLKASSPEQRLQWVQMLHSVAQPSLLTNTTSY